MKSKKQESYHHGSLKDALIEEALLMVESDGLNSITLRELTKKLGTSRSAIYRHYSSKDELITAVVKAGFKKFDDAISPTLLTQKSVQERFYDMGKAYLEFALNNQEIYRMIFGHEAQDQREESCDIKDKESAIGFHSLVALVVEAQEKKIFKSGDPMLQATYIWSNIHGLSNLAIEGHVHIRENLEVLFELTSDNIINGLKY